MTRDWKATLGVRWWAFRNVFLISFVQPSVIQLDETRCEITIPLTWRTRNHLRSMYFGVLCVGADVAGGLIAFHLMRTRKIALSFVFKDVRAEFLKRAEGTVQFTCEDGPAIRQLVTRADASGAREECTVQVLARVPSKSGDEPVARFVLTLSVKKRPA